MWINKEPYISPHFLLRQGGATTPSGLHVAPPVMTADNLAARGMQHNNACPLCQQATEDARHLLINCPFSREVLRAFCCYGSQWKEHHPLALKTNVLLTG
jgi:hypothetical protein